MNVIFVIAAAAILSQLVFFYFVYLNYRYALKKFQKKRSWFRPRVALIIPCKGIDEEFEKNIESFYRQDYENYILWFVVCDAEDAAYGKLQDLKTGFAPASKANRCPDSDGRPNTILQPENT